MSKGDPTPDKKDYAAMNEIAENQAASSRENTAYQTYANRPTQNTPWGRVSWDSTVGTDPATGAPITEWTQNLSLPSSARRALDLQQYADRQRSQLGANQSNYALNKLGTAPRWDNLGDYAGYQPGQLQEGLDYSGAYEVGDPDRYRSEAENNAYESMTRRLDPQWEQSEQAAEVQLRNQGLAPGDEAYNAAKDNLMRAKNDAYGGAALNAFRAGGDEASRMQGLDMARRGMDTGEINQMGQFGRQGVLGQAGLDRDSANYENQLRQQKIAEQAQIRGMTLNEMNALLTGAQVGTPSMPGFNTSQRSDTTDYMGGAGMAQDNALNSYNAKAGAMEGLMKGFGSAATGGVDLWKAFG